jgi:Trk-type K+ transport system membrane component
MPYALVPPGYRAVLIGQAAAIEELGTFAPLEQDSDEGALFLVRLDFTEFPSAEALDQLEQAFFNAGVELWPGYSHVVYADVEQPGVYLAWQKGLAWIPIIVGLLVTVVLPPLLGGLIWKLMPQSLKDLISSIVNMGMMVLVMVLMTKMMPKPTPEKEKPKKLKEVKPAQLEESKT